MFMSIYQLLLYFHYIIIIQNEVIYVIMQ